MIGNTKYSWGNKLVGDVSVDTTTTITWESISGPGWANGEAVNWKMCFTPPPAIYTSSSFQVQAPCQLSGEDCVTSGNYPADSPIGSCDMYTRKSGHLNVTHYDSARTWSKLTIPHKGWTHKGWTCDFNTGNGCVTPVAAQNNTKVTWERTKYDTTPKVFFKICLIPGNTSARRFEATQSSTSETNYRHSRRLLASCSDDCKWGGLPEGGFISMILFGVVFLILGFVLVCGVVPCCCFAADKDDKDDKEVATTQVHMKAGAAGTDDPKPAEVTAASATAEPPKPAGGVYCKNGTWYDKDDKAIQV